MPHLRLSRTVVAFAGKLIVGMHLHGQIIAGIDKFYQQRKILTVLLIYIRPDKLSSVDGNQLRKTFSLQLATVNY